VGVTARIEAPAPPWQGRGIVLGVTGGIAAYKAIQVARDLTVAGARVDVVMSRAAVEFVQPLSFEGVTGRPVLTDLFSAEGAARHIRLGQEADLVVVAPATADLLARAAQGRADDLLTTTLLATAAPVLLCPAMNDRMWAHPQVRANVRHCREVLGYRTAGPVAGRLAVGEASGAGRLLDPVAIVEECGRVLGEGGPLAGRRVLVTAGPTREPVDPVRYVGNRSSGRMGFALAREAWLQGADVLLVSGPSALADPVGVETLRVQTAREMFRAVRERIAEADLVVYAAAVADYRPTDAADTKLKRADVGDEMVLGLEANPDVAADTRHLRRPGAVAVGFALETGDLLANGRAKLAAKSFDMVVANDATDPDAAFEVETNRVTLLHADGGHEELPLQSKAGVARDVMARAAALLRARSPGTGGDDEATSGGTAAPAGAP
jgi:phosphopantothenoylcysteine decarboxylase/phosphopantothenate--cysteine ligase